MEQISRVPQARLVNTYVACLLASCGEIIGEKVEGTLACFLRSDGDQLEELVYGSLPAARASARRCPTRARRQRYLPRKPAPAFRLFVAALGLTLTRALGLVHERAVTVQLLGWVRALEHNIGI